MEIDLCTTLHAPSPIGPVLVAFAVLIALAAVAGLLRRSKMQSARWSGVLLFSAVVVVSIFSSAKIGNWGILADPTTCTALEKPSTWAILIGLNLSVLAAWVAGFRRGSNHTRHSRN